MLTKPYIRGEMIVTDTGVVLKKDNRPANVGEWIRTKGNPDPSGHYYVTYLGTKYYIHRMVAELFVAVPDSLSGRTDLAVHHEDEDKSNNSAENLEWLGFGEHSSLHKSGEAHHGAKLTREDVDYIRSVEGRQRPPAALAKRFGVGVKNITKIWRGDGWKKDS